MAPWIQAARDFRSGARGFTRLQSDSVGKATEGRRKNRKSAKNIKISLALFQVGATVPSGRFRARKKLVLDQRKKRKF